MKIMITNTSARPMCETSTLIFFVATFGASPIPKSWLRHWWAPTEERKSWAPLGLCPPPPPQSKTASGAPVKNQYKIKQMYKDMNKGHIYIHNL